MSVEPKTAAGVRRSRARLGPAGVVVETEGVELQLELGDRSGWRLLGQESLEGLVETFDFAAGLGVVGSRVLDLHTQALQLELQEDLAAAGPGGEDSGVVAEQGGGESELVPG